jgi:hypothetical protein
MKKLILLGLMLPLAAGLYARNGQHDRKGWEQHRQEMMKKRDEATKLYERLALDIDNVLKDETVSRTLKHVIASLKEYMDKVQEINSSIRERHGWHGRGGRGR